MNDAHPNMPEETIQETVSKRILLADDDAAMRRLLEVVLKRSGFEIITAEDGLDAIQKASENKIDLVIADAVMPNLSGYELCRIFRTHPEWNQIPLILLSGMEAESNVEADAHVMKSARLQEDLLNTLKRLL